MSRLKTLSALQRARDWGGIRRSRLCLATAVPVYRGRSSPDRADIVSAVRHKRVRRLWTASILSGVAYMTALTACGWVAFDLHYHSRPVGLVVFASFLPSLIITPFAGVFVDRYDRRTMLPQSRGGI